MNKLSRLGLILLVLAAGSPARGGTDEPLTVVASIFPLKEFAQAVAGDRAEVELFLPPGAEIHTWQPSARQMLTLNRARLFIYVGAHLEPWAASAVRSREKAGLMVLEASRGMPLLHGDPHVWLDFERDRVIVDRIRDALITLDPGEADLFRKNAADSAARLEKLDRSYREMIATCRVRTRRFRLFGGTVRADPGGRLRPEPGFGADAQAPSRGGAAGQRKEDPGDFF
jgi:zinc transport system substrate-binding protein